MAPPAPVISKSAEKRQKKLARKASGASAAAADSSEGEAAAASASASAMSIDTTPPFDESDKDESDIKRARIKDAPAGAPTPAEPSEAPASASAPPAEPSSSSSTGAPALDIAGLGTMFQAMMATMTRIESAGTAQAAAATAQVGALDTKIVTLETQFAEFQAKTAARFTALESAPAATLNPAEPAAHSEVVPPAWVQTGTGDGWGRRAAAPALASSRTASGSAARPVPTSPSSSAATTGKNRIWVKGFVTTQTSMIMATSAKAYIGHLSPALQADARVQAAGFGVAISVVFSSKENADLAFDALREVKLPFLNRSTKMSEALRITRDLPFTARSRNRVTGVLWTHVNIHLRDTGVTGYSLAQSNGRLYVIIDESPLELFKVMSVKEGETSRFETTANFANLLRYNISREIAATWADEASGAQLV
jgi:hypothetical protein